MFRGWVYWLLFLSSYAPLFAVLAIRLSDDAAAAAVFACVALCGCLVLPIILQVARRVSPYPVQLTKAEWNTGDATAYVASYLIPFIPSSEPTWRDLASLAIVLLVLGALYVNSKLVYINPMLQLFGWQVYDAESSSGRRLIVIARSRPEIGPEIRIRELAREVGICQ